MKNYLSLTDPKKLLLRKKTIVKFNTVSMEYIRGGIAFNTTTYAPTTGATMQTMGTTDSTPMTVELINYL